MIARLTVRRGSSTEWPIAERVMGGWQNGATFYPDEDVTEHVELMVSKRQPSGYRAILIQEAREHANEYRRYDDTERLVGTLVEMANMLATADVAPETDGAS